MTLAKYSPGGISTYKLDLNPRNELQSVFKSKGRLFQTRGAATEKRRLPNIQTTSGSLDCRTTARQHFSIFTCTASMSAADNAYHVIAQLQKLRAVVIAVTR